MVHNWPQVELGYLLVHFLMYFLIALSRMCVYTCVCMCAVIHTCMLMWVCKTRPHHTWGCQRIAQSIVPVFFFHWMSQASRPASLQGFPCFCLSCLCECWDYRCIRYLVWLYLVTGIWTQMVTQQTFYPLNHLYILPSLFLKLNWSIIYL